VIKIKSTAFINWIFAIGILLFTSECGEKQKKKSEDFKKGTFGYDLKFLSKYKETLVLQNDSSMIAVCPAYQGRVMTSTSRGKNGLSYGWLNYDLISSGQILEHFNPIGGEDRFWLGPEGGQFSIFFAPGMEFTLDDWQTPTPIDTEPFKLIYADSKSAIFEKNFQLKNYSGTHFVLKVNREIRLLTKRALDEKVEMPENVDLVAYQSRNTITNTGDKSWTPSTGALSIWILGMFTPSDNATVIVPYTEGLEKELGPIVNDTYFGKVPDDRLKISDGLIFFKADGKFRSKIGLSPDRAKTYMGSYDEDHNVLTIVFYSKPEGTSEYVNSLWELQEKPFAGDAANSYNDGPVDGNMLGPFYELESSSPAAFLQPNESLTHIHQTIHIEGTEKALDQIVNELFQVDLKTIKSVF